MYCTVCLSLQASPRWWVHTGAGFHMRGSSIAVLRSRNSNRPVCLYIEYTNLNYSPLKSNFLFQCLLWHLSSWGRPLHAPISPFSMFLFLCLTTTFAAVANLAISEAATNINGQTGRLQWCAVLRVHRTAPPASVRDLFRILLEASVSVSFNEAFSWINENVRC